MRYNPHDYQRQAIQFMIERATAGLFLDPGLGKTSVVLAAFKLIQKKCGLNRVLVIAPLRVAHSVWPAEVKKWDDFAHFKIEVLHGEGKDEIMQRVNCGGRNAPDICVINPEGLEWLSRALGKTFPFDVLVVDESTRFKHANTQRFKTLKPLLPKFKRRYILTGSPAPNGLLDLFGQVFILDCGRTLGPTYSNYRTQFFDQTGYMGYKYVPRSGADKVIYKKLSPLVLRMDVRDLLDMPPLIGVNPPLRVEVELPQKAMAQYLQMENTLITQVEDGLVVAANAAAMSTKCRQIANGGIYTEPNGKKWAHIHEAKVDAVEEIIEELQGKPALVAYEYAHDLERLKKRLGDVPHIGGGVPPKRFKEIEVAWNEGQIPVLLAQPQSVAHGLNLQSGGAAVIWAGLTWNLEDYEQFIRRLWRQGQRERVIVHHIIAKDTVDEVILRGVGKKDRTQQALLGALKDYAHTKKRRAA
jgi:SNF2 family DNA or RNA helicase